MGINAICNQINDVKLYRNDTQPSAAELQTETAVQSNDDGIIVDIVDIQNAENAQVIDTQDIGKTKFNYKSFYAGITGAINASQILDTFNRNAAIYAYTKFQLQENYTGDELTQQLADFDQYFSDIIDTYYTTSYKELDRLNKYGEVISDDTINDLVQSYRDLTYQLAEQYSAYIDSDFDYDSFNNTSVQSGYKNLFMINSLSSSFSESGQSTNLVSDSGYTMEDLAAIELFRQQFTFNHLMNANIYYGMSAEEYGMSFGLLTAKVNYIADHVAASKDTSEMIRSMMKGVTTNVVNKAVTWYASDAYTDKSYKLDEAAFWDTLNKTQAAYQNNDHGVSLKNVYSDAAKKYFSGKQITKNSYYVDQWQKLTDALTVGWNDFIDKITSGNRSPYYIDPSKFSIDVSV